MKNGDFKKHRGEYLNNIVRQKGIKITILTKATGFDRTTYYNHIKDPALPDSILAKYGKVLDYDFIMLKPGHSGSWVNEPEPTDFEGMKKNRDMWRDLYLEVSDLFHKYLKNADKQ